MRIYSDSVIEQSRAPDVTLVPAELVRYDSDRGWVRPDEVPLVVEVEEASSRIVDCVTKVGVYASWAIPLYLRLEIRPELVLYEYRLDEKTSRYGEPILRTARGRRKSESLKRRADTRRDHRRAYRSLR